MVKIYAIDILKPIGLGLLFFILFAIVYLMNDEECKDEDFYLAHDPEFIYTSWGTFYQRAGVKGTTTIVKYTKNGIRTEAYPSAPCSWGFKEALGFNSKCADKIEKTGTFVVYANGDNKARPIYTKKQFWLFKKYFPDSAKRIDSNCLCNN